MDWFIARNGKPAGPLTFEEMLAAARHGQLSSEDSVWQPGAERWEPAANVAALWAPRQKLPRFRMKRTPWIGPALVGLVVSGTALLIFLTSLSRTEVADGARTIKKDCALNDYLQGQCR